MLTYATKTNVPAMRTFQEHYPAKLSLLTTAYNLIQPQRSTLHHTQEHLVNVLSDVTVIRRITRAVACEASRYYRNWYPSSYTAYN